MSHSPEPWREEGDHIVDKDGRDIIGFGESDSDDTERIVACVNACAGISNERLATMDLQAAIECLDNSGGNIDCNDYCGVAHALSRPKEQSA